MITIIPDRSCEQAHAKNGLAVSNLVYSTHLRFFMKAHTNTVTYRCDVVIVFAFLDWVTWQAFVSNDSKKSSRALADVLVKEIMMQPICVLLLK